MGRSEPDALELLLFRVETAARHGKLAEIGLGLEWAEVADVLNANGYGATNGDPVLMAGGEVVDFDISLLETTKQGRTGYAGVYASGTGFRALVPNVENKGSKYLQVRPTALRAAIDRYEWFHEWGVPYGNLGAWLAEYCERNPEASMIEAFSFAKDFAGERLKKPFTRKQLDATIARYREVNGLPPEDAHGHVEAPGSFAHVDPAPVEAAEPAKCKVCSVAFKERERFVFIGKSDDVAHAGCLDFSGQPLPQAAAQ
jgi:hypothetical protein